MLKMEIKLTLCFALMTYKLHGNTTVLPEPSGTSDTGVTCSPCTSLEWKWTYRAAGWGASRAFHVRHSSSHPVSMRLVPCLCKCRPLSQCPSAPEASSGAGVTVWAPEGGSVMFLLDAFIAGLSHWLSNCLILQVPWHCLCNWSYLAHVKLQRTFLDVDNSKLRWDEMPDTVQLVVIFTNMIHSARDIGLPNITCLDWFVFDAGDYY